MDLEKHQARQRQLQDSDRQNHGHVQDQRTMDNQLDNYPAMHAPRFRQIQSQGPSKKDEQYDEQLDHTFVSKLRRNLREPAAEFLGVFIMICFGDGSVAQVNLSNEKYGQYQSISWCWGIGVMVSTSSVFQYISHVLSLVSTSRAVSLVVISTPQSPLPIVFIVDL